jgi:hypothetical protein
MKKVIKLTESDLAGLIKRVINEVEAAATPATPAKSTTPTKPTTPAKLPSCQGANGTQSNCPTCYKCFGGQCVPGNTAGYSAEQFNKCVSLAYPNGNPNR